MLGLTPTVQRFRENCQANWIAQNQPNVWRDTRYFLLLSGYLNYRLTGEFRDSSASQVGYPSYDYKRQTWARKRNFKWRLMPIGPEQLPQLIAPGEIVGALTVAAAGHLGLPTGLPELAATSDKACEVLGSA
ncbi:putative sugar kinase YgcE [Marinobacter sp. BSs20148]|nr:putative sugar kinase YgcE [Marinobacter sp. BSs20148]